MLTLYRCFEVAALLLAGVQALSGDGAMVAANWAMACYCRLRIDALEADHA